MTQTLMSDAELGARVRRAFEEIFHGQLPFSVELSRAHEPRWTSLQHVEFLIRLELEFGLRFDGADATDMSTIGSVLSKVRQKLS
jgi:acyl carrier protein